MEVHKFGNADFEWTVGLNRYSLKAIGVWPEKNRNEIWNDLHVGGLILLIICSLLMPQAYALVKVINELPLIVDNVLTYAAYAISVIKLFLLWYNKKKLIIIMAAIKYDWNKRKDDWEREIMLALAKRGRFITICGITLVLSSVIGMLFGPFIGISFRVINNITDRDNRYFPAQTYYPYDFTKTPYFEMTYVVQVLSTAFAGVSFTSCVTFFSAIVFHNCGQLSILGWKITNLFSSKGQKAISDNGFGRNLKEIIDSHTRIIRIVDLIEMSFNHLILAQVLLLTVQMCCLGFQILNAMNDPTKGFATSQMIILAVSFLTILMHTFVYCFAGEALVSHCEELHRRIGETDWYLWESKFVTSLMLILIRSQQPLLLTMGKFIDLNLRSFATILKTAAGYISMLIAVSDDRK